MLRHLGVANRGSERDHRTQPQISEGIGKMYPAKPRRMKKMFINASSQILLFQA
jgi:hypothetical protein